jgi:hypothetical protein
MTENKDSFDLFFDKLDRKQEEFFKRLRYRTMRLFTNAEKYGFKNAFYIEKRRR